MLRPYVTRCAGSPMPWTSRACDTPSCGAIRSTTGGWSRRATALRMARVLHVAAARLAVRAVLPAERRVHDAGVPRAPLQPRGARLLHVGLDHRLRPDQN